MSRTPQEQLVHFLSDMYSVEQQALAQLVSAPDLAGDSTISQDFRAHYAETETHAELVRECLEAQGGSPSMIKDAVMRLGGKGFLLFARAMPETTGHLLAHAYSYEAMEWAGYEMLLRFAEKAGDSRTAGVAKTIRAQERDMMQRLEHSFDAAEAVSHANTEPGEMGTHLRRHLAEAHALETQGIRLLEKSEHIAGDVQLSQVYHDHLSKAREHARLIEQRLEALDAEPSKVEDGALALGGMNWGLFFQAQSDTAAKLVAFAYAFEHLKIAGYELLRRTAQRAGDADAAALCEGLLAEERAMAGRLAGSFDAAVQSTLEALGS